MHECRECHEGFHEHPDDCPQRTVVNCRKCHSNGHYTKDCKIKQPKSHPIKDFKEWGGNKSNRLVAQGIAEDNVRTEARLDALVEKVKELADNLNSQPVSVVMPVGAPLPGIVQIDIQHPNESTIPEPPPQPTKRWSFVPKEEPRLIHKWPENENELEHYYEVISGKEECFYKSHHFCDPCDMYVIEEIETVNRPDPPKNAPPPDDGKTPYNEQRNAHEGITFTRRMKFGDVLTSVAKPLIKVAGGIIMMGAAYVIAKHTQKSVSILVDATIKTFMDVGPPEFVGNVQLQPEFLYSKTECELALRALSNAVSVSGGVSFIAKTYFGLQGVKSITSGVWGFLREPIYFKEVLSLHENREREVGDMRSDNMALSDLKHRDSLTYNSQFTRYAINRLPEHTKLLISVEKLSQVLSQPVCKLGSTEAATFLRINQALTSIQTVNEDRYSPTRGDNSPGGFVTQNTAFAANFIFENEQLKLNELPFPSARRQTISECLPMDTGLRTMFRSLDSLLPGSLCASGILILYFRYVRP
jgi:hypothetical protein